MKLPFMKPKKRSCIMFTGGEEACCEGYTSLDHNPEIIMCVRRIADIISSMTIHLMANSEKGDVRIKNELSRMIDITPSPWMTRKTWMEHIVMTLLLYGRGNAIVLPHTSGGLIEELEPIPYSQFSFVSDGGRGYKVVVNGVKLDPDEVLHFVFNPCSNEPWRGQGLTIPLRALAETLKTASDTKKSFMASKWKPSLIIKVDALTDEFSSPDGRKKLLDEYVNTSGAGEPWLIPAEQFSVEQVKPLSLADLAISDSVTLDKKSVAALLGVPAYVVGVGEYKADEWNAFINNTIRPIARNIEQELTRKLLVSPKMYWRFNIASHYSYDLRTTANVYSDLYTRGIVTGNEVRDKMNMEPKEGLDELTILENYIPLNKIAEQMKLKQEEDE